MASGEAQEQDFGNKLGTGGRVSFTLSEDENIPELLALVRVQQIQMAASLGVRAAIEPRKPHWTPVNFTMVNKATHHLRDGVVALLHKKNLGHLLEGGDREIFLAQTDAQVLKAIKAKRDSEKAAKRHAHIWDSHAINVHDLVGLHKGNPSEHLAAELLSFRALVEAGEKALNGHMRELRQGEGDSVAASINGCTRAKDQLRALGAEWEAELLAMKRHVDPRLDRLREAHVLDLDNLKASVHSTAEHFVRRANARLGCKLSSPAIVAPAPIVSTDMERAEIDAHPFNAVVEVAMLKRDFNNLHAGIMMCLHRIRDSSNWEVVDDLKQKLRMTTLYEREMTDKMLVRFTTDYETLMRDVEDSLVTLRLDRDTNLSSIIVKLEEDHGIDMWLDSAARAALRREQGQKPITDYFPVEN